MTFCTANVAASSVAVILAVGVNVSDGMGVSDGVGVLDGVTVKVGLGVEVGVNVGVAVNDGVNVDVNVGVEVRVAVDDAVTVGDDVGVLVALATATGSPGVLVAVPALPVKLNRPDANAVSASSTPMPTTATAAMPANEVRRGGWTAVLVARFGASSTPSVNVRVSSIAGTAGTSPVSVIRCPVPMGPVSIV